MPIEWLFCMENEEKQNFKPNYRLKLIKFADKNEKIILNVSSKMQWSDYFSFAL